MRPDQHEQIVVALGQAARDLAGRRSIRDLEETLGQIVASAVKTIPGVDGPHLDDPGWAHRDPASH